MSEGQEVKVEELRAKLKIAVSALTEIAEASDLRDIKVMFQMQRTAMKALRQLSALKDDQLTLF